MQIENAATFQLQIRNSRMGGPQCFLEVMKDYILLYLPKTESGLSS